MPKNYNWENEWKIDWRHIRCKNHGRNGKVWIWKYHKSKIAIIREIKGQIFKISWKIFKKNKQIKKLMKCWLINFIYVLNLMNFIESIIFVNEKLNWSWILSSSKLIPKHYIYKLPWSFIQLFGQFINSFINELLSTLLEHP